MPTDIQISTDADSADTPRFWAGGHNWSTGSKLAEFLEASGWWHGFTPDDERPAAVQTQQLFPEIRVGDYFAIKGASQQGFLKVWFAGIIDEIDAEAQRLHLTPLPLPENSTIKPAKGTPSVSGTLREVTDPALIGWMFHGQPYLPEAKELPMLETDENEIENVSTIALNTILYGPPGTGKTYNTIRQAVAIIDGVAPGTLSMAEAKPRWDELRGEGRIEFVTFHQSYGYEDFVEGIRPVMTDEAAQTPRYEVLDGILKKIALRALGAMLERKPEAESSPLRFSTVWECLRREVALGPLKVPTLTHGAHTTIARISDGGTGSSGHVASSLTFNRESLAKVYAAYASQKETIRIKDVDAIPGIQGHPNYLAAIYNYIKSKEPEWSQQEDETEDLAAEGEIEDRITAAQDYLALGSASGYNVRHKNECPKYVLVIDEINRGNISKIFGELITLIEDDKRIGGELALTVTLPHSRETFGLPSNLYLLGTMNTADKSIALVDVALRRRFEFEEMLPDFSPAICPGLSAEMRDVLNRLNQRIVLRKDRDHQIGHAFFVAVRTADDFNRVFTKKIIPLLQEYFYGDWESLRYVLGEANGKARFIVPLDDDNEAGARNRWQWYRDAGQTLDALDALMRSYKIGAAAPTDDAEDRDE